MSKICRKKRIISYTSDVGLQPGITGADEIYSNCSRKAWDLKYSGT